MDIKPGILRIRVRTGAPKTQVLGLDKGVLRIAVKARPEKGKPTWRLLSFLRKSLRKKQG